MVVIKLIVFFAAQTEALELGYRQKLLVTEITPPNRARSFSRHFRRMVEMVNLGIELVRMHGFLLF